jgi:O-antigen ligase
MIEQIILACIVIVSALLFGSVEKWSFALVGIATLCLYNLWLIRGLKDGLKMVFMERSTLFMILAFLSYVVIQVLPVPFVIIEMLSPKKASFLSMLSLDGVTSISVYPYATVDALLRLIVYILLFTMSAFLGAKRDDAWQMLKIIVYFGFLLTIFAIIQKATWNGQIYWFRELTMGGTPFGPFVNRNHFAGFIGMIIPFGLALSMWSQDKAKKFIYMFVTVIMTLGLFFSLSRGGIISFIISALFFVIFVVAKRSSSRYRIVMGIFISLFVSYLIYFGMTPILDRFTYADVSMGQRAYVWEGMMTAARDFSIVGSGLGTFPYISHIYHPEGVVRYFDHAHNDYLEFVIDTGVTGLVLLIALCVTYLRDVMRSRWWKGRHFYFIPAGISSIVYITVHSMVDFNLHIPSNAIMFSVILGLVCGRANGIKERKRMTIIT